MNLSPVVSGLPEHEADESDHVEACERGGIALVIFDEPSAAGGPGKRALNNPTRGSSTKPRLASAALTTSRSIPCAWEAAAARAPV